MYAELSEQVGANPITEEDAEGAVGSRQILRAQNSLADLYRACPNLSLGTQRRAGASIRYKQCWKVTITLKTQSIRRRILAAIQKPPVRCALSIC